MPKAVSTRNVLWTGGWDSTFHVLDLAINQRQPVSPFYVLDPRRRSHLKEMETVETIRRAVLQQHPGADISPLKVIDMSAIAPDERITAAFTRLAALSPLGGQYDWLARARIQFEIERVDLCIHRDDKAYAFVDNAVRGADPADFEAIFGGFEFPILFLTKADMEHKAKASGFLPLMELTWFCHKAGPRPCGVCGPCRYTIEENMGRRLPWRAHLGYHLNRPRGALVRWLKPTLLGRLIRRLRRRAGGDRETVPNMGAPGPTGHFTR